MEPSLVPPGEGTFTFYKRRLFILASVALLNATNAMIWNSFSTIAGFTHQFYNVPFDYVNGLATIFLLLSVPVGFLSMWCIDHIGTRISLNAAAGCNAVGAVLRLISATSAIPRENRYAVLFIGQSISGLAQPFAMSAPAKIAQNWFPDRHRTFATAVGSMANALGVLLSALISPLIVTKADDLLTLQIVYTVPACVTLLAMLFSLTRSRPATPPSSSANVKPRPFCSEFAQILRNKMYVFLAICCGIGVAIVTAMTALSAQILCPKGYDGIYSGMVIALMIGLGLGSSIIISIIADRTGLLQEIGKFCLLMAALSLALFVVVFVIPSNPVGVAIVISLLGIFGFGQYPIVLELAVETAYPVGEATSSGLIIILGYVGSVILVASLQATSFPVPDFYGTCGADTLQNGFAADYTYGTVLLALLASLTCITAVLFYQCPYRRRTAEAIVKQKAVESQRYQLPPQNNESMTVTYPIITPL